MGLKPTNQGLVPARSGLKPARSCGGGTSGPQCDELGIYAEDTGCCHYEFTAILFSLEPGETITSIKWDFGDGTTGSGEFVTHIFPQLTSYTVTLTVKTSLGLQCQAFHQVICALGCTFNGITHAHVAIGGMVGTFTEVRWENTATGQVVQTCTDIECTRTTTFPTTSIKRGYSKRNGCPDLEGAFEVPMGVGYQTAFGVLSPIPMTLCRHYLDNLGGNLTEFTTTRLAKLLLRLFCADLGGGVSDVHFSALMADIDYNGDLTGDETPYYGYGRWAATKTITVNNCSPIGLGAVPLDFIKGSCDQPDLSPEVPPGTDQWCTLPLTGGNTGVEPHPTCVVTLNG